MRSKKQDKKASGITNPQNKGGRNTSKHPDTWTTGDERMTGAQRSYLQTLSQASRIG